MARIRAVLVGIDEYQRQDIPPLCGCVNDVAMVRWLLKQYFDVPNRDIRVVVNQRATKANILNRLRDLLERSMPGDVAVFYFSGHGSQVRDRDGDELEDHLDEVICPYDMDWDERSYIDDDEFAAITDGVPRDVLFEGFFDCCFWGAVPRMLLAEPRPQPLRPDVRYLPPPMDIYARAEGEQLAIRRMPESIRRGDGNVVWAASQEGRPASEDYIDGRAQGIFTYWGCRFIADYIDRAQRWNWPREGLLEALRAYFRTLPYAQTPQLSAQDHLLLEAAFTPARRMGRAPRTELLSPARR
jgi:metacaspase-1